MEDNVKGTNAEQSILSTVVNKSSKDTFNDLKQVIEQGDTDPAYIAVVLKKFAKIAELAKKDTKINELLESEVKKYQEGTAKTFNVYGAKVTLANRGFMDYSKTEDPVLKELAEIEKEVKERIKLRKAEVEALAAAWESQNSPQNVVKFGITPFNVTWNYLPELVWNEGYGEIETNPPAKRSTEQLRFSV